MNTSTRLSFAAVLLVGIVAGLCLSACPHKEGFEGNNDKGFCLKIGNPEKNVYVDVKSQDAFDDALIKVKKSGGDFKINYLCKEGANVQTEYNPEHPEHCNKAAKDAESETTDRVAAGDPNATQKIRSPNPDDLTAVLATFAQPSPTPSP
jgi:hypothetical protein